MEQIAKILNEKATKLFIKYDRINSNVLEMFTTNDYLSPACIKYSLAVNHCLVGNGTNKLRVHVVKCSQDYALELLSTYLNLRFPDRGHVINIVDDEFGLGNESTYLFVADIEEYIKKELDKGRCMYTDLGAILDEYFKPTGDNYQTYFETMDELKTRPASECPKPVEVDENGQINLNLGVPSLKGIVNFF